MSGGMGFLATAVIVQSLDSVVTVTTPFTMTGGFQGFSSTGGFSVNMTGSGILTLELNHAPGGGIFQFRKATYTFQTPEPSTVVLLITGLLGIIVLRKKIASHGS
jgi:PEP-CTERM putative exosortase interaction domain